jgi:hypothetical protein
MARNVAMCGEGTETQSRLGLEARKSDRKHSKPTIAEIPKYCAGVPSVPVATADMQRLHLFCNRDSMPEFRVECQP